MNNFLVFTHDSGEIIFMKRDAITAFHPKYVHTQGYIIYASDGAVEKPIHKTKDLEEAKAWIMEQIELIEGLPIDAIGEGILSPRAFIERKAMEVSKGE